MLQKITLRITFLLILALACTMHVSAGAQETYQFERMWPSLEQPWYFFGPSGVAVGPEGSVYVVDSYVDRIKKFTKQGQFVSEWGSRGDREGEFEEVLTITVDTSGYVYVLDRWNFRVQKFNADGQFVLAWGDLGSGDGEFARLRGIAADNQGFVYVADTEYFDGVDRIGKPRIQKFTAEGQFVNSWGDLGSGNGQFADPAAIAASADGYVYVTDTEYFENEDNPESGLQIKNHRVQKFTSNGQFVSSWGEPGSTQGKLDRPLGVAVDGDGNVYVVDTNNDRIQKFSADGQFIKQWGLPDWMGMYSGYESGEVYFSEPVGIAVDASGTVFVTEITGQNVQSMTNMGAPIATWGSGGTGDGWFMTPQDVAVDAQGFVYVVDMYNTRIQKFTSSGQFVTKWGRRGDANGEFLDPSGVAVDASGFVYVIDDWDQVQKFDANGNFVTKWGSTGSGDGQFAHPTAITVDPQGYVYVADTEDIDDTGSYQNYRIQKFTSSGQLVTKWGSFGDGNGEFNFPAAMAADAAGNIYVVDQYNYRIQKFSSEGVYVSQWGTYGDAPGQLIDPTGVAIGPSGNVYVADRWNYRIEEFTPDGQFVSDFGELGSDPGMFSLVKALAFAPDGRLYVVDAGYNRVQVFTTGSVDPGPGPGNTVDKAIIVAGSGPYQGNTLWDATQMNANHAYRTLTHQGFNKKNIYYLSADTDLDLDGNGILDDVDSSATNANLQQAITQWASDADDVVLYLVGHGGNGSFRMGETETLRAADLDQWLDALQQTASGTLVVVYDACESGSFLPELTPPPGEERILLTSTSPDESAYFINAGAISFSYTFWSQVFDGGNVYDSFITARNGISFAQGSQNPLIDDNGDGIGNQKEDGTLARSHYLGMGIMQAADLPVIGSVNVAGTLSGETSATIRAEGVTTTGSISRVWAVITPPGFGTSSPDVPVTSLPVIDFSPAGGNAFVGTYGDFSIEGEYRIAVFAADSAGNMSLPRDATVTQTIGIPAPPVIGISAQGGTHLSLSLSLAAGGYSGSNADWWLVAVVPAGELYYLNLDPLRWEAWLPGLSPTLQSPLFDLPAIPLGGIPGLPEGAGTYTFYFGVDMVMDAVLNGPLYFNADSATLSGN